VQPSEGASDSATEIAILGTFHPLLRANYDDESRAEVSTDFKVTLGSAALTGVRYHSASRLTARVPAGLAPGIYDMTVRDPRGRTGTLEAAFTVLASGSDAGPDAGSDLGVADAGPEAAVDGPQPADGLPDLPLAPDLPPSPDAKLDGPSGPSVSTVAGSGVQGFKDGPPLTARFFNPLGIAVHGGAIYVADYANHRIRLVTSSGVSTFAGDGVQGQTNGAKAKARFNFPAGLALSADGKTLYVADSANDMIRVIKGGSVTTLAGSGIKGFLDGPAANARFNFPRGVAVAGGKVYVADAGNHRLRAVSSGSVTTLAGSGVKGFLNGAAASARFNAPHGVTVDGTKVLVADTDNNRIRAISGGTVTTLAGSGTAGTGDGPAATARFWNPVDLVLRGGKVYVVDQGNHRIRSIAAGKVTTFSGSYLGYQDGPVTTARFHYPHGIAVEPTAAGPLYIADQSNHRIRKISF
jgi:DNA-binding beta-propeller fold protein YncE